MQTVHIIQVDLLFSIQVVQVISKQASMLIMSNKYSISHGSFFSAESYTTGCVEVP